MVDCLLLTLELGLVLVADLINKRVDALRYLIVETMVEWLFITEDLYVSCSSRSRIVLRGFGKVKSTWSVLSRLRLVRLCRLGTQQLVGKDTALARVHPWSKSGGFQLISTISIISLWWGWKIKVLVVRVSMLPRLSESVINKAS